MFTFDPRQGHFWIGLNRADNAPYHRWDHCESTDGSSFTFWAEEPATDKKCVFAENDILRWKNEVCDSSSYQYLCQEDTGEEQPRDLRILSVVTVHYP